MKIEKVTKNFGVPWEKEYGYSQAVKVGDTIYLAGQVSHADKGNIIGPGNMEAQMRQAYLNIQKLLAQYGATMENLVDEILFVTNMDTAFTAAVKCRKDIFGGTITDIETIDGMKFSILLEKTGHQHFDEFNRLQICYYEISKIEPTRKHE